MRRSKQQDSDSRKQRNTANWCPFKLLATHTMSDYEKIARAIDYLRSHSQQQPTLAEVARQVNLSEFHFQRLFSRWAGVTPKRYLQALTLEHAKQLLQSPSSVFDASLELGLSGQSRLYDHFVQLEAVTPSEYKSQGEHLTIRYGYHTTPFGEVFIATTERGICQMDFVQTNAFEEPLARLQNSWPKAQLVADAVHTGRVLDTVFSGSSKNAPLSIWVKGTNFQINVWRALLQIQKGSLATYSQIANTLDNPKASRAVGTAIGANPIALVIPCHRVIRQSGELGGYRWGMTRKHAILVREMAATEEH